MILKNNINYGGDATDASAGIFMIVFIIVLIIGSLLVYYYFFYNSSSTDQTSFYDYIFPPTPTETTPTEEQTTRTTRTTITTRNASSTQNGGTTTQTTQTTQTTRTTQNNTATTPTDTYVPDTNRDQVDYWLTDPITGLVINIGAFLLADIVAKKIDTTLFRSITNTIDREVFQNIKILRSRAWAQIKSPFIKASEKLFGESATSLTVSLDVGEAVGKQATEKAAQEAAELAAKETAEGVAESGATMAAEAATFGPVGIGLLLIQGLTIALDVSDAGGYNMLETWRIIKEEMKKQGAGPPKTIGPIETLMQTPDLSKSQKPHLINSQTFKESPFPNPSLYDSLAVTYLNSVMANDADYQTAFKNIVKKYVKKEITDVGKAIEDFFNTIKPGTNKSYIDYYTEIATNKICTDNKGIVNLDGSCMYGKDYCMLDEKNPYAPGRKWSDKSNKCFSLDPVMKGICEQNHMEYNIDTGICDITADMCLTKDGVPEPSDRTGNQFVEECRVSIGIEVCAAILGDTICKGLDQIFNPNQYYPCDSDEIDNGLMCMKKCRDGYDMVAGVCWSKPTTSKGPANSCPSGWTSNGSSLCYPNCSAGYNFQGVDSNSAKNYTICVKNCSEYNMVNGGNGICYSTCPEGYDTTGTIDVTCTAHSYTVTPHPADSLGPRGGSYIPTCLRYDQIDDLSNSADATWSQWSCNGNYDSVTPNANPKTGLGWDHCATTNWFDDPNVSTYQDATWSWWTCEDLNDIRTITAINPFDNRKGTYTIGQLAYRPKKWGSWHDSRCDHRENPWDHKDCGSSDCSEWMPTNATGDGHASICNCTGKCC